MGYKYSKAYDYRGSSMGRRDIVADRRYGWKVHLERVPIDSGGYDPGGAYWGLGEPLYVAWFWGENEMNEIFFRAYTREEAKEVVRKTFPNALFYR